MSSIENSSALNAITSIEPKQPLIFGALAAILLETNAIAKDSKNAAQGFNFRGIDAVLNALHPIFAKHKVFITNEILSNEVTERQTKNGGSMTHRVMRIRFTFWAVDGSHVSTEAIGEAADSGDKSAAKCASIALKYCLFQALLIPTQDADPDENSHEFAPRHAQQPAPAPAKIGPITPDQKTVISMNFTNCMAGLISLMQAKNPALRDISALDEATAEQVIRKLSDIKPRALARQAELDAQKTEAAGMDEIPPATRGGLEETF